MSNGKQRSGGPATAGRAKSSAATAASENTNGRMRVIKTLLPDKTAGSAQVLTDRGHQQFQSTVNGPQLTVQFKDCRLTGAPPLHPTSTMYRSARCAHLAALSCFVM